MTPTDPLLLSARDAAALLAMSPSHIRVLAKRGELTRVSVDPFRVSRQSVDAYSARAHAAMTPRPALRIVPAEHVPDMRDVEAEREAAKAERKRTRSIAATGR